MTKTYSEIKEELLENPSVSYFLKGVIKEMETKDSVDVLKDLEVAVDLAKLRLEEIKIQNKV